MRSGNTTDTGDHVLSYRKSEVLGATSTKDGIRFEVWAPNCKTVGLKVWSAGFEDDARIIEMQAEDKGGFSIVDERATVGSLYGYLLDGDDWLYPDPVSRFQPQGPFGPSEVIDPGAYEWQDKQWRGTNLAGQVVYELHIGTFTSEGTWKAATLRLARLRDLGITLIEVMPVNEFAGEFGWGYDGVDLYAPT